MFSTHHVAASRSAIYGCRIDLAGCRIECRIEWVEEYAILPVPLPLA
jgi:hypothetical protein